VSDAYYLKTIGDNYYRSGTSPWLKIRGFKALKDAHSKKEMYELEVRVGGRTQFVMISDPYGQIHNLEFKDATNKPVSFLEIIRHFKDRSVGLLIS